MCINSPRCILLVAVDTSCTCACVHVCANVCACTRACACVCVCMLAPMLCACSMRVCVRAHGCACVHVCMQICKYVHVCMHVRMVRVHMLIRRHDNCRELCCHLPTSQGERYTAIKFLPPLFCLTYSEFERSCTPKNACLSLHDTALLCQDPTKSKKRKPRKPSKKMS